MQTGSRCGANPTILRASEWLGFCLRGALWPTARRFDHEINRPDGMHTKCQSQLPSVVRNMEAEGMQLRRVAAEPKIPSLVLFEAVCLKVPFPSRGVLLPSLIVGGKDRNPLRLAEARDGQRDVRDWGLHFIDPAHHAA